MQASPVDQVGFTGDVEPTEQVDVLMRDLRASPLGLSEAEAQRRLIQYGPNELTRRGGRKWPADLARQLTHPLALLLWLAAALSFAVGSYTVAIAVLLVIGLNAVFAFAQELQAEKAVEALAQFLPQRVTVLRGAGPAAIPAAYLVPGDIVVGRHSPASRRRRCARRSSSISAFRGSKRGISCSAARARRAERPEGSCSRRECIPSSAASPPCQSA
jgi:hypothetical protein